MKSPVPLERIMWAVVALIVMFSIYKFSTKNKKSEYSVEDALYAPAPAGGKATKCGMKAGTGLASSLLPREVASKADFGEFKPDDVLKGQKNFLEPRSQVGFPESVGGALRNANQQIRADPPVAKKAYVWSNSTISADTMQRDL
tara:strand:+ start:3728 stop:4159 length:432 start_codon:yes stop_codon:yes gene_type:complete